MYSVGRKIKEFSRDSEKNNAISFTFSLSRFLKNQTLACIKIDSYLLHPIPSRTHMEKLSYIFERVLPFINRRPIGGTFLLKTFDDF